VRDSQSLFDRAGLPGMDFPLGLWLEYRLSRCVQLDNERYERIGRIAFSVDELQFRAGISLTKDTVLFTSKFSYLLVKTEPAGILDVI
jgi:hypothetical protein